MTDVFLIYPRTGGHRGRYQAPAARVAVYRQLTRGSRSFSVNLYTIDQRAAGRLEAISDKGPDSVSFIGRHQLHDGAKEPKRFGRGTNRPAS